MDQSFQKTTVSPNVINKIDTPRTSNIKFLRAKRLEYYDTKSKSTLSGIDETPSSLTPKNQSLPQPQKSRTPRRCLSAPNSREQQPIFTAVAVPQSRNLLQSVNTISEGTCPHPSDQELQTIEAPTHRSLLRSSFISDLDQNLLEDISVPESEKLQHVMNWAKKFLNKCKVGDSLHNSSVLSSVDEGKLSNTNEQPSSFLSIKSTNSVEQCASFCSTHSPEAKLFSTLHNKDIKNNDTESDTSTLCDKSMESKVSEITNGAEEKLAPQKWWMPRSPGDKTNVNNVLSTEIESDPFSSQWLALQYNDRIDGTTDLAMAHGFSEDQIQFTDCLPDTSSQSTNNVYFATQFPGSTLHEKEHKHWKTEPKKWDYDTESTGFTEPKGNAKHDYYRPDSASSLDSEQLEALLLDLEIMQKAPEKRRRPTENPGVQTDRTFLVNKFAEYDTTTMLSLDSKSEKSEQPYKSHSNGVVPDILTVKSPSVCPVCDCTNNTNTSWCTECGCALLATNNQIHKKKTVSKSPVTHESLVDEMFVPRKQSSLETPSRSVETLHRMSPNLKDVKRTLCWEDNSDETSDCDGSVLEKYFFYVNQLDMIRSQEQNKQSKDTLFSGRSSEEEESSEVYGTPYSQERRAEQNFQQTDAFSDCEGTETQFLGTLACVVNPELENYEKQTRIKDRHEENVKVCSETSYGTKILKNKAQLDRNLQMTTHISSRGTGPKRYWEKSSIAWSSYTHGELKPRSTVSQRPLSAETRKKIPNDPYEDDKHNDRSPISGSRNPTRRPSSASLIPVSGYQSNVAYMKTANAWTVSEHLCRSKWNGFLDFEADNGSMWLLLPDELWISIFSQLSHKDLSQVAQVCQRFRHIASDDSLWKIIEIANSHSLNDDCLASIGLHHPESLSLYRCHDDTQCITEDGLRKLFQHCKDSLMELKITNCSGQRFEGDTILLHASNYCNQLISVDVSWTAATDKGINALVESSQHLKNLSVNGCKITDHAINALVKKHCKSLIKLEVFGCHALTATCLTSVATECTHLQTLNIGRIPKITDVCLAKIASHLKHLTTLNVTGLNVVRDRAVHLLVKQCPKLENLTLSSCSQVTDVSLVEISTYQPKIKYLDISGCKKVTDIGIQALSRSCQQIHYLDLSSTGTGKRGVCLLASYCHGSLECVKLSFCKDVTADAIEKLCKNCKKLKMLHLYGCRISPNLESIKKLKKTNFKIFHDLSIPTANILGD
ncbi:uncharacterized protein O3C94_002089 [Discoglossus pictus]